MKDVSGQRGRPTSVENWIPESARSRMFMRSLQVAKQNLGQSQRLHRGIVRVRSAARESVVERMFRGRSPEDARWTSCSGRTWKKSWAPITKSIVVCARSLSHA
jgi:hypothetical protein